MQRRKSKDNEQVLFLPFPENNGEAVSASFLTAEKADHVLTRCPTDRTWESFVRKFEGTSGTADHMPATSKNGTYWQIITNTTFLWYIDTIRVTCMNRFDVSIRTSRRVTSRARCYNSWCGNNIIFKFEQTPCGIVQAKNPKNICRLVGVQIVKITPLVFANAYNSSMFPT